MLENWLKAMLGAMKFLVLLGLAASAHVSRSRPKLSAVMRAFARFSEAAADPDAGKRLAATWLSAVPPRELQKKKARIAVSSTK